MSRLFLRRLLTCFAALSLLASGQAQVALTEFLASNNSQRADEEGEFSDWIEVQNTSASRVNLQDWSLTDDPALPAKWRFPATNLNAGAFLVVFASGKDRAQAGAQLHTSFSLAANGEYLALFPPDSSVPATEFAPEYPAQKTDISFGTRAGQRYFFSPPSPGLANTGGFADFVADTKFSHDRGFYEQAFDLVISTATAGATIRYTTNGTPPSLNNGFTYAGPISLSGTAIVRAAAFKAGLQPSGVDTHTYLFLADVIRQATNGVAPPGWPASWGFNVRDYGMDPDIVNSALYRDEIIPALKSLPSFSVVTDLNHLFNASTGIYANPGQDGRAWERPISLELMQPDGKNGFQVNAGIRIRGGFSRSTDNPKHALRFFFREEYGDSKLKYPLFGDQGADEFDALDLRTFQNYSWSFQGDSTGVFIRDQFSRDTQLAMGRQGERGNYYHLYINGQYWGLYNTCERPEAAYSSTYYGGNKEDWDVIKVEAGPYTLNATDGDMQAWTRLYNAGRSGFVSNAAYFKIEGRNADGTPNPAYENLLDVDNLIDYMLVILFGGNLDAPISNFLGNSSPNNWYGQRNRSGAYGGFRFTSHDAEHTLLEVTQNRTGPFSSGDTGVSKSNPQWIWQKLSANPEFRLRVADRVQAHFFNGGALTPEAARARFGARTNQIYSAVVAESARWGDSKRPTAPLTRQNWLSSVNEIMGNYFNQRSANVLNQLRSKNLYPATTAPGFSRHGGVFSNGFQLALSAPVGTLHYTTDGSDPRLLGGAVSPTARSGPSGLVLPLTESVLVRARALNGTNWSALNEADFILAQTWRTLAITELMYNPPPVGDVDGDRFEFIELKNTGATELDLSGVGFTNGLSFTFPRGSALAPGAFAVLVSDRDAFTNRHPTVPVAGVYAGKLANGGERLTLSHATGETIFEVTYGDAAPWPASADGGGFSLVPTNPNANPDPNVATHWRASAQAGGSPGSDDPVGAIPRVVINELLTHTDPPLFDSVELHNPTAEVAEISGWFLTDDARVPNQFRLPNDTVIPAGGYLVLTEADFNQAGSPNRFNFSSHGEQVWLFSANAAGTLTGYSDGFSFPAAANGDSFGRYTNSVGELQFPTQAARTFGAANAGPALSPVVISEFNYHPRAGDVEFVELHNLTDAAVPLFDPAFPTHRWRVAGLDFEFPAGALLPARGFAVVTAGDPTLFRSRYGIPAAVPVFGPFLGNLQDGGERLELQRPDSPDFTTNSTGQAVTVVPYLVVDSVRYRDQAPWPTAAAGLGATLERRIPVRYGDDPAAWRASPLGGSPGFDNRANRPPVADAGPDRDLVEAAFPVTLPVAATATDDGQPGEPLSYSWSQISGPAGVVFGARNAANTTVAVPGTGLFGLRVTVSDGELASSDDLLVSVTRSAGEVTLLAAGSLWRYLDTGVDQGTAWRAPSFNDSAWPAGRAQLGFGDSDETTVIGFGPDAGNKYPTTYFRTRFNVLSASSMQSLKLGVLRDDGAAVYLNGVEIFRSNLPEGTLTYNSLANSAVGGADESAFFESPIDLGPLLEGENVLAVEVHQSGGGSSDLSFDLTLTGQRLPGNTGPTAGAGSDRTTTVGEPLLLTATFTDDGLPSPPGVPTFTWTQVSGPGTTTFTAPNSPQTIVTFDLAGTYRLRFGVNDSLLAGEDEVQVSVTEATAEPVVLSVLPGTPPQVRFTTQAGVSYTILARDQLTSGAWLKVLDVPAGTAGRIIDVPLTGPGETRYLQVVSPMWP
jgi:hypothetical protein